MVVLVTGCSRGFGHRTCVELAQRGHTVYAGLRDPSAPGDLPQRSPGLDIRPLALDVVCPDQRSEAVKTILDEAGHIDGLVNNAGIAIGGMLEEIEEDELRRVMEINFFGLWALTREVLPAMRNARSGAIVNISSRSGVYAMPAFGPYAASKWAVEALSESWRYELGPFGIRVHVVQPGPYRTHIWNRDYAFGRRTMTEDSPYRVHRPRLEALVEQAQANAHDPRDVAVVVADLLEGRRSGFRHPMGPGVVPSMLARRFLPFSWIESVIRKKTGLMAPPR